MRLPEGSGERRAVDKRGGTGEARAAGDDLRQRLDRLAACHPSSPDYRETAADYGDADYRDTAADHGEPAPDYRDAVPDYGETDYGETEYDVAGAGAERARDEQDRQAARSDRRGDGPAGRLGPGRPAGWRPGPGHRPDGGAASGPAGRSEPYEPWFTAGESPDPWFTGDSGT